MSILYVVKAMQIMEIDYEDNLLSTQRKKSISLPEEYNIEEIDKKRKQM